MRLSVIGAGYVGLVTAACFAEMGNNVTCVEKDEAKLAALRDGRVPFYEPGLSELVANNHRQGRLRFSESIAEGVADAAMHFIAVGTPSGEDGSVDLTQVLEAAREIGEHITRECIVVDKSTVPVGTCDRVRRIVQEQLERRGVGVLFDVVSNPEFLKEGNAVSDFMRPDRIIVGADSERSVEALRALYAPFIRNRERLLVMSVRDAEMTKYAANAMLATRISFMNEIAGICERLGVDVENVRRGIGSDSRIGHSFIYPGCGYGGFCFPKDMRALINMAETNSVVPELLRAVEQRNQSQKRRLFEKIREHLGARLSESMIGVWGLSFKPGTDDVREAPALVLIRQLLDAGARVRAYDPVAVENARGALPNGVLQSGKLEFVTQQYDAIKDADAMALVTEWKPFRNPDFEYMKRLMKSPVIFDGRNQYEPKQLRAMGFQYFGIGR